MKTKGKVQSSVNFQLAPYKDKKGEQLIICYIHINRWYDKHKPITFSTGLKINPAYWMQKENEALAPFDYINTQLDVVIKLVEEKWEEFGRSDEKFVPNGFLAGGDTVYLVDEIKKEWEIRKKQCTYQSIIDRLVHHQIIDKVESINENVTFINYIERTIEKKLDGNKGSYNGLLVAFTEFNKKVEEKIYKDVTLANISPNYFVKFLLWCAQTKDWTRSTFETQKKNVKLFYNYAKNVDKLNVPLITWKEYKILEKMESRDTKDVALSYTQLEKLYQLEFSPSEKHLEDARDSFIIGSFVGGLRPSDFNRIKNIKKDLFNVKGKGVKMRYITGITKKNHIKYKLPIQPTADEILLKHNDVVPKIGADFSKNIREVCRRAGLKNHITVVKEDISQLAPNKEYCEFTESEFELHSLVSPSTIRKTFCTMMKRKYKFEGEMIIAFSQHSSTEMLDRYIADSGDDDNFLDLVEAFDNDKSFEKKPTKTVKLKKVS